jgi:nicotinate-nucleotide adenylyltransferase
MYMIGILGGTFDPIHYGHLRPAAEARAALGLSEVRLIPAARPPHRAQSSVPAGERLALAQLAAREQPGFTVDDRELRRAGPSYTVLTLEELRRECGDTAPICLIIGADAFAGFDTWHRWPEILALAHLVVMSRPDSAATADPASWPAWARPRAARSSAELAASPAGRVMYVEVRPQRISATDIRRRVARGESIDGLVPPAVGRHIHQHGLYRSPPH